MRLRAWGLVANFAANSVFLFGLSRVMRGESGLAWIGAGAVSTLLILAVIAVPDKQGKIHG
jgi:hypothetical protein